jgi:large subunit ribosomal protein L19e
MANQTVRRIAAQILGVGESRIRFKNEAASRISEALTREDIRSLIKDGSVFALPAFGVSRIRGREKAAQKKKGRRSGKGSKKGTFTSRGGGKRAWISKVRAQRAYLKSLLAEKKISSQSFRKMYMMVKGNAFKGVKILETHLKDTKLLK